MRRHVALVLGVLLILVTIARAAEWTRPYVRQNCRIGWDAPTQNEDESALTDLAGFRVCVAATPGGTCQDYTFGPTVTQVRCPQIGLVEDPNFYYVRVYAFDGEEPPNESSVSNEIRVKVTAGRVIIRR
jgi:hypothetical protein